MRVGIDHPNDRPNFARVNLGEVTLWFSYQTCIAFQVPNHLPRVRENDWGPTTGKHLNMIDNSPATRTPGPEFEEQLAEVLDRMAYRPGPTIDEIRAEFVKELVDA